MMSNTPRKPLRAPSSLSLLLLSAGFVSACTGSVDSSSKLDADTSAVDSDGQVITRDGQAGGDDAGQLGSDGSVLNDSSVSSDLDAQLGDSQVAAGNDASFGSDAAIMLPPQGEPVFVAFGSGFWTATSCDRGRSWRLAEESSDREQHGPWSAFGRMAFGKGVFVGGTGWGAPGHLLSSNTGLMFGNQLDASASISGVGYTGSEFVLLTGDQVRRSADGRTWAAGTFYNVLPGTNQIRYFRSFPELGVAIASSETQMGNASRAPGLWTQYSTDGLRTWKEATGNFGACAKDIQQGGDIVAVGNTMLMGAPTGALCRSTNGGVAWQVVDPVPATPLRDLWSDGQSFYALAARSVYRLEGAAWALKGTLDMGDTSAAGATSNGTTVIAAGAKFFWSDTLGTWQQGTTTVVDNGGSPLTSPEVRDMVVGHYPKACP